MSFFWCFLALSYLLGAINSCILWFRLFGLQSPLEHGSKNPGTTNALRLGGKKVAFLTLLTDVLKGVVPVAIARYGFDLPVWEVMCCGFFAVLGHVYPIYFGFKGGKGVATTLGALWAIAPWLGAAALLSWLLVARLTRLSSLAALVSIIVVEILAVYYFHFSSWPLWLLGGLVFWRHRANIKRLCQGQEPKIGQKA